MKGIDIFAGICCVICCICGIVSFIYGNVELGFYFLVGAGITGTVNWLVDYVHQSPNSDI